MLVIHFKLVIKSSSNCTRGEGKLRLQLTSLLLRPKLEELASINPSTNCCKNRANYFAAQVKYKSQVNVMKKTHTSAQVRLQPRSHQPHKYCKYILSKQHCFSTRNHPCGRGWFAFFYFNLSCVHVSVSVPICVCLRKLDTGCSRELMRRAANELHHTPAVARKGPTTQNCRGLHRASISCKM